jgi:transcriptional regulator of heat shock response
MPPTKKFVRQTPDQLTPRQTKLLFALVKEYCETGASLGSKELKEKYNFNISSATIRNEQASLREMGYLYQPFVNSSSTPTEKSFKLFINQLIVGLGSANKQQSEMQAQITLLQQKQADLSKEIAKFISNQTNTLGFSVTANDSNISGMKYLLTNGDQSMVSEVLDFLDHIDTHKQTLLTHSPDSENGKNDNMTTFFADENAAIPLGKGYALVASKIEINGEEAVIGIISPTRLLADPKKIASLKNITKMLK